MFPRWWRLGIRPQLTIIVVLGALLSTVATLFIANTVVSSYVSQQADAQQQENMRIAQVVLQTQYGQNVSVASDDTLVADQPTAARDFSLSSSNNFGRYSFKDNTDFVDEVQLLIQGAQSGTASDVQGAVSVYKCADAQGKITPQCTRIETTMRKSSSGASTPERNTGTSLEPDVYALLQQRVQAHASSNAPVADLVGTHKVDGVDYAGDYTPIFSPDGHWIGVLYVGVPQSVYTSVVTRTTLYLIIIGLAVMLGAVILALIFANTVVSTLQRAARQVSGASERIGSIANQQASGAAQQVWAINAINQALQNFSETARDISQRTDQLALMGNQVLQRRQEISPTQIDSILAYITRSVRDISAATRQQASQYERMSGAMQAVTEIADQVASNSKQSAENSERLDVVVGQLQQLVGVRLVRRRQDGDPAARDGAPALPASAPGASAGQQATIRAVRPSARHFPPNQMAHAGAAQMPPIMNGSAQMNPMGHMGSGRPALGPGRPDQFALPAMGRPYPEGLPAAPGGQMRFSGAPQAPNSGPGPRGDTFGGRYGAPMGDEMDYRLPPMPPMPEMPQLPNWGGPMPNAARAEAREAPRGRGGPGAMSGPHSNPFAGGGGDGW